MFPILLVTFLAVIRPDTDRTIPVEPGTRLAMDHYAGDIIIRAWDRNEVRIVAEHSDRERVDVSTTQSVLRVRTRGSSGIARSVDVTVTVPKWMPVAVEGNYGDVTVEGTQADVSVQTVRGDVNVHGGGGIISLRSVEGDVVLEAAKARVTVNGINRGVRVADVEGEITAETVNGDIDLVRVRSAAVDAASINGSVLYDGTVVDGGRYRLSTHNGAINMAIAETANATIDVRTYGGGFRTNLAAKPTETRAGRRYELTLGKGSAQVDLESFQGSVRVLKPGTLPEKRTNPKKPHKEKDGHALRQ